ncbi:unnamed protein product [Caenorhabditis sp. 36 PRJEB53466]|nr:unnamed protein product [Caenorhabditis sp. 36 PRJEB53466]
MPREGKAIEYFRKSQKTVETEQLLLAKFLEANPDVLSTLRGNEQIVIRFKDTRFCGPSPECGFTEIRQDSKMLGYIENADGTEPAKPVGMPKNDAAMKKVLLRMEYTEFLKKFPPDSIYLQKFDIQRVIEFLNREPRAGEIANVQQLNEMRERLHLTIEEVPALIDLLPRDVARVYAGALWPSHHAYVKVAIMHFNIKMRAELQDKCVEMRRWKRPVGYVSPPLFRVPAPRWPRKSPNKQIETDPDKMSLSPEPESKVSEEPLRPEELEFRTPTGLWQQQPTRPDQQSTSSQPMGSSRQPLSPPLRPDEDVFQRAMRLAQQTKSQPKSTRHL